MTQPRLVTIASREIGWTQYESLLRRLSVIGALAAVGALMLQQALRPNLSPISDAISAYDVGAYAYVQTLALWTLGAGSLAIAMVLRLTTRSALVRCGAALVAAWGVGIAVLGVITVDDGPLPTSGGVHEIVATLAFAAAVAAVVCVSHAYAREGIWTPAVSALWSVGCLVLAGLTAVGEDARWFGATERALGVMIVCWLIAVGRTSRKRAVFHDEGSERKIVGCAPAHARDPSHVDVVAP
jgi:hypothetical membrane protein